MLQREGGEGGRVQREGVRVAACSERGVRVSERVRACKPARVV